MRSNYNPFDGLEEDILGGVDFDNRIIRITGEIEDNKTFNFVDTFLNRLELLSSKKPITIRLNSIGGSVYEALAIVGRIRRSPCLINIEAYGQCASAATYILAAGDHRSISKYCSFMYHEISYGTRGRTSSHRREYNQVRELELKIAQWVSEFTDIDNEWLIEEIKKGDLYFSPEECLTYGIVDEIIE